MERLATDWKAGVTRFDRDGEALVGARVDEVLAGIGRLTVDPVVSGALRMRRFYVRPSFREHGIGRKLVGTLLEYPRRGRVVVVNASGGSPAFWEKLGFAPDMRATDTLASSIWPSATRQPDCCLMAQSPLGATRFWQGRRLRGADPPRLIEEPAEPRTQKRQGPPEGRAMNIRPKAGETLLT